MPTLQLTRKTPSERLGKILAYILSAPVMALILVFIVSATLLKEMESSWPWVGVTTLFVSFIPLAGYLIPQFLKTTKKNRRIQRRISFLSSLISFSLGAVTLWLANAPRILMIITFCYVAVCYSLAFVNLFYKASGHAAGVAGPAVIYLFLYGLKALPVLILIPLIMWARVKEQEHSFGQTVVGAIISAFATFLVIRLL
ncbi:MAG TPA: hypothetical protein GXX38_05960 [Clostridia bacterium]|jgi:membrane-associated phospholipid phosphatase|nr:hypothetical protein [Clostridia bacterium]